MRRKFPEADFVEVSQADFVGVCVLALSHDRHAVVLCESPKLDGNFLALGGFQLRLKPNDIR